MVEANAFRGCQMRGCNHQRVGLGAWCRAHSQQAKKYGHPDARPLKPSQWAQERKEVQALFKGCHDHPGLLQVLGYLGAWVTKAVDNERAFKGAREIVRLKQAGISEEAILTETCAFWLWSRKVSFPSDRAFDYALSRAVFALAPRPRRSTRGPGISGTWGRSTTAPASYSIKALPSALAYVGKYLRQVLSTFLSTVSTAIEQQRATKVDPLALQRLPFPIQPALT
jgi:hypothetical protein